MGGAFFCRPPGARWSASGKPTVVDHVAGPTGRGRVRRVPVGLIGRGCSGDGVGPVDQTVQTQDVPNDPDAGAPQADDAVQDQGEEIVVTGFRQSLSSTRNIKRNSDQIVDAMKARNIPVTYVVFPDEGHGFARPANNIAFNAVAENFLAKCLGGRAEPVGGAVAASSAQVKHGAEHVAGLGKVTAAR